MTLVDLVWLGAAALYGAGCLILVIGWVTAPEGYEDAAGFHRREDPSG